MKAEAYQPILAILDEGLWLYRRHFLRFVLIAALWLVPIAIVAGLVAVAVSSAEGISPARLRLAGGAALLIPMFVYLIGGVSRAAVAAAQGRDVRLREAWALRPLRVVGTSVAAIIYGFFAELIYGSLSMAFGALIPFSLFAPASAQSSWIAKIVTFAFGGIVLTIAIGMPFSTLTYVLQPWFLESRSWQQSFERSNGLVLGDIGACFLTTLLVTIVGLNIGTVIGLLPIDSGALIGRIALIIATIVIVLILFPPVPIWMALLYHRETNVYSGTDLAARIAEWQRQGTAPDASGDLRMSDFPRTIVELPIQQVHKESAP